MLLYAALKKKIAHIVQIISWPFVVAFLYTFFKIEVSGRENLKGVRAPLIVASNHIRFYDGFLFYLVFPFYSPLLPIRFMAVNKFDVPFLNLLYAIGITPFVYIFWGVFIVYQGQGIEKGLRNASKLLEGKNTIGMFPEGSLVYNGPILPFKKGTAVLSMMTNTPVLPMSIKKITKSGARSVFKINIGKTIRFEPNTHAEEATKQLQQTIEALFSKN